MVLYEFARGEIMDICIKEHHGYFSLDMGYYNGNGFNNSAIQNIRLSLIFISSGQGELCLNGNSLSFDAPVLLCVNETESIQIPTNILAKAILFHPSVVNASLDFDNIRTAVHHLSVTEQQDCFYFEPFLHHAADYCGVFFPSIENAARIDELFDRFFSQVTLQDSNYWACRSRSCLIELLFLARMCMERRQQHQASSNSTYENHFFKSQDNLNATTQREVDNEEILRIIDYLESNLHQKMTIADLTKRFQTNRTDLSRLFLNYTGKTIMQYVNDARIELAATMLRDTTIPISEAMERAGFFDYAYFSKTFRKQKGLSPRNYRKKYCWML